MIWAREAMANWRRSNAPLSARNHQKRAPGDFFSYRACDSASDAGPRQELRRHGWREELVWRKRFRPLIIIRSLCLTPAAGRSLANHGADGRISGNRVARSRPGKGTDRGVFKK